jgi:hypothetical protein
MPRGDKSSYTDKQKRQAEHIEEGYEKRGISDREAARRAWATVNKETHGGKKSGSGRGKAEDHAPSRKGGRLGGRASASRPAAARSRSAKRRPRPASSGHPASPPLAALSPMVCARPIPGRVFGSSAVAQTRRIVMADVWQELRG